MSDENENIVQDAIARNMAIVLSLPSAGMLRHNKSRFLEESAEGFWVESAPNERVLIDDLIGRQQQVGISFKCGTRTVSFLTTPLVRDPQHRLNGTVTVEALLLKQPSEVKSIQRRSSYRVRVGRDSDVSAKMWRLPDQAYIKDKPGAMFEVKFELSDLSVGGMGVLIRPEPPPPPPPTPPATEEAKDGETAKDAGKKTKDAASASPPPPPPPKAPRLTSDQRVRIDLSYGGDSFTLEGRVRHMVETGSKAFRVGIQFKKLENDMEGRQTLAKLTRIIGELQREEVRRMRLGIKN